MLAAFAASTVGWAQTTPESAADRQRQIVDRIEQEQARNGPGSEGLVAPLTALGLFYQEHEEHGLAAEAFQRARRIVRVNYGLYAMEEAPLLRQLVHSHEARGNVEAAWNLEQDLLALVRRHPDDLRVVPVLREIADKRMDLLERYRAGAIPPEIVLGCYYVSRSDSSCNAGSRRQAIRAISAEAQWYRAIAIEALLRNGRYESEELRELEAEALAAGGSGLYTCGDMPLERLLELELVGTCLDPVLSPEEQALDATSGLANDIGRPVVHVGAPAGLVRLVIYEVRSGAPPLSRANALVRLADWHLRSSHAVHGSSVRRASIEESLELYDYIHRQLEREGVARAAIDRIFAPVIPVVLPTSEPNPLLSEATSRSSRYVDIAFDVTRHGYGADVEILYRTAGVEPGAEKDLVRSIEDSTFRPRVSDGELAEASRVVVRYHFSGEP